MPVKNYLHKIDLTQPKQLQTLVENRRVFNLQNCELNVFESYQEAYRVPLTFHDLVITSMVRGKKVMHLFDKPSFDYLPGETVIVPADETMVIDFPEAEADKPTQCIALAVDARYVNNTIQYLDNYYNSDPDTEHNWKLQFNQYHFANENEVTDLINKLIRVCSGGDKAKNIYADLNLKELLIRLMQSQHLLQVSSESGEWNNHSRLHHILHYINDNLTEKIAVDTLSRKAYMSRNDFFRWFKEQFGITPLEYINRERIKLAKQLLIDPKNTVTSVAMQCGFTDVNYFVRLFRKAEGITPGAYQSCSLQHNLSA
ncbi:AraC family transcriptional regulator [Lacibacter luteus]|uniref:AraC family transcriptional regulator n=1 Tax=Lacibacter luteus TaxID=2508719 RepID=A0A4Q1CIF8_9BACT|nr:AraC family transcriptional regulator [Lacibacter luteus]RXK60359.1 AraC family transcriptional regulator [Lacibacter luteus]